MSVDDGECQECGLELLLEDVLYTDGQGIICPDCGATHWICCDSETPVHLHGPDDDEIGHEA